MSDEHTPIEVFCSYVHEDEPLLQQLEEHLSMLKRQRLISIWHDRQIVPGTDWAQAIDTHLNSSSVILLLISSNFLATDYCSGIEMERALKRHQANEARVIPILLRPVDWKGAPFAHLQLLPTDARPITTWPNQDEAFADVAVGIRRVVSQLTTTQFASKADTLNYTSIRSLPVVTDPKAIQQREGVVREIYAKLIEPNSSSVVLIGIGGIGKSTLTALVFNYAESQRKAAKGPFIAETIMLRIDATTTFIDLATKLFRLTLF